MSNPEYFSGLIFMSIHQDMVVACSDCKQHIKRFGEYDEHKRNDVLTQALRGLYRCDTCVQKACERIDNEFWNNNSEQEEEQQQEQIEAAPMDPIVSWLVEYTQCDIKEARDVKALLRKDLWAHSCGDHGVAIVYESDLDELFSVAPGTPLYLSPFLTVNNNRKAYLLVPRAHVSRLTDYYYGCFGKHRSVSHSVWVQALVSAASKVVQPEVVQKIASAKRERACEEKEEKEEEEEEHEEEEQEEESATKRNRISWAKQIKEFLIANHMSRKTVAQTIAALRMGKSEQYGRKRAVHFNEHTVIRMPFSESVSLKDKGGVAVGPLFDSTSQQLKRNTHHVLVVVPDADQSIFKQIDQQPDQLAQVLSELKNHTF